MMIDRRTMIGAGLSLAAAPLVPTAAAAARRTGGAFPKGFLWGAATAAYQVEGNNINSDTWVMEHVKPTIYAEPSGDAVNSFELWPQDLDIVKQIGLNTYRFSLEWGRIEPEPGMFSIAMLDHYKAMIDGCRERGLTPMVSFNHFTTPRWFAAMGAWTNPEAPQLFARFCDRAARHLAGGMAYATTLNEPNLSSVVKAALSPALLKQFIPVIEQMTKAAGRATGSDRFVSGNSIHVPDVAAQTRTMIAAHKAGRAAIKAVRSDLPVGFTLAMPDDQAVGRNSRRDAARAESYVPWLEAARGNADFLGVQNYLRVLWDSKGVMKPKGGTLERNASGEELYAPSLANAVRYAYSVAKVPIIVTEHGANTADDAQRARLIPAALIELKKAMDEGIPVGGYIHWSLLDNFEWIFGYKHQYGLVAVDRTTFKRTPKPSAAVLGAIAQKNAV